MSLETILMSYKQNSDNLYLSVKKLQKTAIKNVTKLWIVSSIEEKQPYCKNIKGSKNIFRYSISEVIGELTLEGLMEY